MKNRFLMNEELSPRHKKILRYLVEVYISRSEPVGSKMIVETCMKDLSAATIRHCLEEIEQMGYLKKPHTSAGRIPTEKGFRYYVTELMKDAGNKDKNMDLLKKKFELLYSDYKDLLKQTIQVLSEFTHQTAMVLLPNVSNSRVKAVDFIKIGRNRVLSVVVFKLGFVENKMLEVSRDFSQSELSEYAAYINSLLESESTLSGVRSRIIDEMKNLRELFDLMLANLYDQQSGKEMIVEGQGYLLDTPEFADVREMKKIFNAFKIKSRIMELLDGSFRTEGVRIYIGKADISREMEGVTLITASYGNEDIGLGTLGIIGPVRMDYSKVIPAVDSTAKTLSRVIEIL